MEELIKELKELLKTCRQNKMNIFIGEPTSNLVYRGFEIHPNDFTSEIQLKKKIERLKLEMSNKGIKIGNKYFEDIQTYYKELE